MKRKSLRSRKSSGHGSHHRPQRFLHWRKEKPREGRQEAAIGGRPGQPKSPEETCSKGAPGLPSARCADCPTGARRSSH